jgi:hypothetical protein
VLQDVPPAVLDRPRVGALEAVHACLEPADLGELCTGRDLRHREQVGLVRGRRHARHRAHLRIGDLAGAQRLVDPRKLAESSRHADLLSRGRQIHSDPPRQPVRARDRPGSVPGADPIELTQLGEEPVRRHVDDRGGLGDGISHRHNFVHREKCILHELIYTPWFFGPLIRAESAVLVARGEIRRRERDPGRDRTGVRQVSDQEAKRGSVPREAPENRQEKKQFLSRGTRVSPRGHRRPHRRCQTPTLR